MWSCKLLHQTLFSIHPFFVPFGNVKSLSHDQINGVPQRSVLSLNFFNIALANTVDEINPLVKCIFFAGDLINFFSYADYSLKKR